MIADLSRTDFVARFGGVYEHSRWVAEKCFEDGMHHTAVLPSDLAGPMSHLVEAAGPEPQMILLRAHPDLAGKLARSGTLTAESTSEQAGLDWTNAPKPSFRNSPHSTPPIAKSSAFPTYWPSKVATALKSLKTFASACQTTWLPSFARH